MFHNRQAIVWGIVIFLTIVLMSIVFTRFTSVMNAEIISALGSSDSEYVEIMYSATTIKPKVTCALMYGFGLQNKTCLLDDTDFMLTGYLAQVGNSILTKTNEEEQSYVSRDDRIPNRLTLFLAEKIGAQPTKNDGQSFIKQIGTSKSPTLLNITYLYSFSDDNSVFLSDVTQAETISITSSNKSDPSIARVGDIISVTFTMNRPVISDQVSAQIAVPFNEYADLALTIATAETVVTDQGNNTFVAKYKVPKGALPGPVEFELYNLMDYQQNSSVPNIYTETTDGSVVTIVE